MHALLTNYPWLVYVCFSIGAAVLMACGAIVLYVLWFFIKATLQTCIYILWQYKKATINGRKMKWFPFWKSFRSTWWELFGERRDAEPRRRGNSFFYGWTFTVAKDSSFVTTEEPVFELDDEDEEDECDPEVLAAIHKHHQEQGK